MKTDEIKYAFDQQMNQVFGAFDSMAASLRYITEKYQPALIMRSTDMTENELKVISNAAWEVRLELARSQDKLAAIYNERTDNEQDS